MNPEALPRDRFKRWLREVVSLPIVFAIVITIVSILRIQNLIDTFYWVDHTDQVISQARKVERLLIDAETGVRGFAATKDPVFLDPYNNSLAIFQTELDAWQNLISDNPVQAAKLNTVREQTSAWLISTKALVAGSVDGKSLREEFLPRKKMMDGLRLEFTQFIAEEHRLRDIRIQRSVWSKQSAYVTAVALTIILGLLLSVRIRSLILRVVGSFEDAIGNLELRTFELAESRERFSTTLTSIGDAVIAVDTEARVDFLNPIAERLTGWSQAEAKGKGMEEVFKIINQETRAEAVNPVSRVIAEGIIVGLANHTVLISKNGVECPIEDSAAPIRDTSGNIRGVVLVFRDVSERHDAEKKRDNLNANLQIAVKEAQDAVHARDNFMSIASHELKTPLTSLKLQNQMLLRRISKGLDSNLHPDEVKRVAELADRQINQLSHLIDDMLDVSRITTGKLQIEMSRCDLSEIISNLCDSFNIVFDAPNVECRKNIKPGVFIEGDEFRIQQVMTNLINNALKYGLNKPIAIELTSDNGFALIKVIDQGIGISTQDQKRIFGRFERAVAATSISGFGLGLYISKQIVEGHHGTISVESEAGRGSTFTVRLPLKA